MAEGASVAPEVEGADGGPGWVPQTISNCPDWLVHGTCS